MKTFLKTITHLSEKEILEVYKKNLTVFREAPKYPGLNTPEPLQVSDTGITYTHINTTNSLRDRIIKQKDTLEDYKKAGNILLSIHTILQNGSHGDFWPGNLLFDEKNTIWIIDFEKPKTGPVESQKDDIAKFIIRSFFPNARYIPLFFKKRNAHIYAFLKGYNLDKTENSKKELIKNLHKQQRLYSTYPTTKTRRKIIFVITLLGLYIHLYLYGSLNSYFKNT